MKEQLTPVYVAAFNRSMFRNVYDVIRTRVRRESSRSIKAQMIGVFTDEDGRLRVFYRNNRKGATITEYRRDDTNYCSDTGFFAEVAPQVVDRADYQTLSGRLTPRFMGTFRAFLKEFDGARTEWLTRRQYTGFTE